MTTVPLETIRLITFDGGVADRVEFLRPDRYRMIEADLGNRPRIARGGGYSYAAASFGAGSIVLDMARFNRVLRFDSEERLIEVEAGMTLGDLLTLTAPAGLWLPVQPGYPAITVGGCIAANVHGKNPAFAGTIVHWITNLTLFHPKHGTLRIDRTTDGSLFALTCGGYGLTGVILAASLHLEPLPGTTLSMRRIPIGSLSEGLGLVRRSAGRHAFTYTWHDAAPAARTFGRGIVYEGVFVPGVPRREDFDRPYRLLTATLRARLPISAWNPLTTPAMNSVYWQLERARPAHVELPLFDSLFPFARSPDIFQLFGRRGFIEYQVLVPEERAEAFLSDLQRLIVGRRAPAVLLSVKLFKGSQRLLRFEGDGVCITLYLTRSHAGLAFLPLLDELTRISCALPNLIKDSRLPRSMVQASYPEYGVFRDELRAYDPGRIFRSELSERLGL